VYTTVTHNKVFLTVYINADEAFRFRLVANFNNQVTEIFLRWGLSRKHKNTVSNCTNAASYTGCSS